MYQKLHWTAWLYVAYLELLLVCHDLTTSFVLNLLYFMSSWPYLNTTFNNLNVLINIEMMMCLFLYLKIFQKEAEMESWCSSFTVPDLFSIIALLQRYARGFAFVHVPVFHITSSRCSLQLCNICQLFYTGRDCIAVLISSVTEQAAVTNWYFHGCQQHVEKSKLNIQSLSYDWKFCIDNSKLVSSF